MKLGNIQPAHNCNDSSVSSNHTNTTVTSATLTDSFISPIKNNNIVQSIPKPDKPKLPRSLTSSFRSSMKQNSRALTFNKGDNSIRIFLKGRPVNMIVPSNISETLDVKTSLPLPDENIKMNWVYGYRGRDCRKNVYYLSTTSELVYFVAGVVVIHNLKSNEQRHYVEHTDDVKCLAIHPDKVTFASGQVASHSKVEGKPHVRVWSSITLQTLQVIGLGNFNRAVVAVAFSKSDNGAHLCTVDEANDHNVSVWDWNAKKQLATAKGSTEAIIEIEFDPKDANTLVSAGKNHLVFWNLKSGSLTKKTAVYDKYEKPKIVTCFIFTSNGDLITGDSSGNIFIWNKEKRIVKQALEKIHDGPVFTLLVLSDDKTLVSGGGKDKLLLRWDLTTNEHLADKRVELDSDLGFPRSVCETESDKLALGTTNNSLIELDAGNNIRRILVSHHDELWALADHPGQAQFVSGAFDGRLLVWDALNHSNVLTKVFNLKIQSLSLNPVKPNICLIGGIEGQWHLVDIGNDANELCSGKDGVEPIQCCEFSPDGTLVALGSRDNAIYVYSLDEQMQLQKLGKCTGHSSFITHLDWSRDSKSIRSNSGDYEILFWNSTDCKQVKSAIEMADIEWATCNCTLAFETAGIWPEGSDGTDINAVTRAHNKTLLATADDFGKVNLYRYPACTAKSNHKSKPGHSSHVTNVKFLTDDQYLLSSGGQDTAIIQWTIG